MTGGVQESQIKYVQAVARARSHAAVGATRCGAYACVYPGALAHFRPAGSAASAAHHVRLSAWPGTSHDTNVFCLSLGHGPHLGFRLFALASAKGGGEFF